MSTDIDKITCVSPKTPKSGEFASPVRYFYFTPPDFSNVRKLFLIALSFLPVSFLSMQVGGDGGI